MPSQGVKPFRKFGGEAKRRALFKELLTALVQHDRIETTVPKARDLQRHADKLITLAKRGTPKSFSQAQGKLLASKLDTTLPILFSTLRDRYANRNGGYTRIIRNGNRDGQNPTMVRDWSTGGVEWRKEEGIKDHAQMAIIEFVDSEGNLAVEMNARALGRKVYEEEIRLGQQIPINDPTIFAGDRNWELKMKLDKAISFRPEFRAEIEAKAEAWRQTLRAQPKTWNYAVRDESVPKSKGYFHQPGELLPAMAVETPLKSVSYEARHAWARLPINHGGRGGYLIGQPDPVTGRIPGGGALKEGVKQEMVGVGRGETSMVQGVDGVEKGAQGAWGPEYGGGNGEYPVSRKPMDIAYKALAKRRSPVPRFTLGRDGMGG